MRRGAYGTSDQEVSVAWRRHPVLDPLKAKGTEQLKVWPTNANRAAFEAVMSPDGPPPGHVNDPANLIDEAFEHFKARTSEYLAVSDEDAEEPRLVMALSGVEASLYTNKTDITELPEGLTVEHVIPRTWETDWLL